VTKPLVSGRDFQLRYAIVRAVRIALGIDSLSASAARLRLEWPIETATKTIAVDVALEAEDGTLLEIIECKEHEGHLDIGSVRKFLDDVAALRDAVPESTIFRFVSTSRFLSDGTNFSKRGEREKALKKYELRNDEDIIWEATADSKDALTALCVFHFAGRVDDARATYSSLYARLAGQMSHRLQAEGEELMEAIKDLHVFLFNNTNQLESDLNVDAADAFEIDEIRRILGAREPEDAARRAARTNVDTALRRSLFDESPATLDDVFVEPAGTVLTDRDVGTTAVFTQPALSLLFRWTAESRDKNASRAGQLVAGRGGWKKPLLLFGDFGSGKSSLLTMFARRLLDSESPLTPILIPLRDLTATGKQNSLVDVLPRYVEVHYGRDFNLEPRRYVLLCDGFDELNLFFADDPTWVETCWRQLDFFAQSSLVIVSSRPVLFHRRSDVVARSTTITLQPFDDARIAAWSDNYRAATTARELSFEFLADRNLVEVARTPIVLYMISRIVETNPEMLERKAYTRAAIYKLFIDWTQHGGYVRDEKKHELPENYREILQEVAWHLFQSAEGFLRTDDLLALIRQTYGRKIDGITVGRNLLVAHMLRPAQATDEKHREILEFTHQSFREYLVAERVWRILEPARNGKGLDPAEWARLGGKPLTSAKLALLSEIIAEGKIDELQHLYDALAAAENLHLYWSKWSAHVWASKDREATKSYFETLAPRAFALAALAFMIRVKCYRRLLDADTKSKAQHSGTLQELLAFSETFTAAGFVPAARAALLENLGGLRLDAIGGLERTNLIGARFDDADLSNVNFSRANATGIFVRGSRFVHCDFEQVILNGHIDSTQFTDCNFENAIMNLLELRDVTFRNCRFARSDVKWRGENVAFL
jgi:hypothetical protein